MNCNECYRAKGCTRRVSRPHISGCCFGNWEPMCGLEDHDGQVSCQRTAECHVQNKAGHGVVAIEEEYLIGIDWAMDGTVWIWEEQS